MKKPTGKLETISLEEVAARKLTPRQRREIVALGAMLPEKIDTSDIPEAVSAVGWMRNSLYRPITRPVTIRLSAPDIAAAQTLSKTRGLPYQTYIKQLLHEALERELLLSH